MIAGLSRPFLTRSCRTTGVPDLATRTVPAGGMYPRIVHRKLAGRVQCMYCPQRRTLTSHHHLRTLWKKTHLPRRMMDFRPLRPRLVTSKTIVSRIWLTILVDILSGVHRLTLLLIHTFLEGSITCPRPRATPCQLLQIDRPLSPPLR